MRAKGAVFIATSLDGFIARADGSIDWLSAADAAIPAGEDCGYREFFDSVDAIVMGRHSYELVSSFDIWPYGDKRMVVLSSKPLTIPEHLAGTVSASSETPTALVTRLSGEGCRSLYVDGGLTIQSFLAAELIDEITITMIPVLLGSGIPLFGPLSHDIFLRHVATKSYDFGYVQVKYSVDRQ